MDLLTPRITVEEFRATVHGWAKEILDSYLKDAHHLRRSWKPKEINDPVWGTIAVNGAEVAVLDSPIFQRLRYVRQLGVVHWVYPGAVHTRFEHAVGVLHVAERMLDAINRSAHFAGITAPITPSLRAVVRLAALMHDSGHLAFSHVSEKALDQLPQVQLLLRDLKAYHGVEKGKLSEFIAAALVDSPSFKNLIRVLLDNELLRVSLPGEGTVQSKVCSAIGKCILGQKFSDELPTLQEIVTGPFDADKVDYLARDSKYTGVPIGLDVSRLLQKIAVAKVATNTLPSSFIRSLPREQKETFIIGLKASGRNSIDEIHIARTLLFSKVYRHHKVLAIEAMFNASIQRLLKVHSVCEVIRGCLTLSDDAYLFASTVPIEICERLLDKATGKKKRKNKDEAGAARAEVERWQTLVRKIRARVLFARAFVFRPEYGRSAVRDSAVTDQFQQLYRDMLEIDRIIEAKRIIEKHAALYRDRDAEDAEAEDTIWIVSPRDQEEGTIIGRAFLINDDGSVTHLENYPAINASNWSQAYNLDASSGYVFAERSDVEAVHYAVHAFVAEQYQVSFPPIVFELARISRSRANTVAKLARSRGRLDEVAPFARPVPECLERPDGRQILERVVQRLEGLQLVDTQGQGLPIFYDTCSFAERLVAWLSWFRAPSSAECALICLDNIKILERADYSNAVKSFVSRNPEFNGAIIARFGEAKDSSAIAGYFTADLEGTAIDSVASDWTRDSTDKPIIFFDDFVSSGGQAEDIIGGWHGNPSKLGEARLPLESSALNSLRERKVGFVFATGWQVGTERVQTVARDNGIEAAVFTYLGEGELPYAETVLRNNGKTQEEIDTFKEECSEIARRVLPQLVEKKNQIPNRLFGYGNRGMLLAFPYNIPSQTITAFWMVSTDRASHAFVGPLPRRKKT